MANHILRSSERYATWDWLKNSCYSLLVVGGNGKFDQYYSGFSKLQLTSEKRAVRMIIANQIIGLSHNFP